ncbi:hypothetical protein PXK01_16690 [Phaeobacter sp. PT47_59]|uniref:hypothetical protein n=1 Tax=Phaeobacter sp. PT47_59 TaxID=3029979 RepID=UPI0023807C75|nr:hypothetical protein [Phaeobacter sp. PT47_59]MDE4175802.1 hypothetical protein [Phaeobacter sp. PT47_59]
MFNVLENPTFTRPVPVQVPKGDGIEEQTFKATFNALDDDATEALAMADVEGTKDFLRRAILSMDDLSDEDGKSIPYSEEIREAVIARPYARIALMSAYHLGMNGLLPGN